MSNAWSASADDFDEDGGTLYSLNEYETLEHVDLPLYAFFGAPPSDLSAINDTPRYSSLYSILPLCSKTLNSASNLGGTWRHSLW